MYYWDLCYVGVSVSLCGLLSMVLIGAWGHVSRSSLLLGCGISSVGHVALYVSRSLGLCISSLAWSLGPYLLSTWGSLYAMWDGVAWCLSVGLYNHVSLYVLGLSPAMYILLSRSLSPLSGPLHVGSLSLSVLGSL